MRTVWEWDLSHFPPLRNGETFRLHFEVSPREKEDEDRRHRRDFDTDEQEREDQDDRVRRAQEGPPEDG